MWPADGVGVQRSPRGSAEPALGGPSLGNDRFPKQCFSEGGSHEGPANDEREKQEAGGGSDAEHRGSEEVV